jgi:hypothetical protein
MSAKQAQELELFNAEYPDHWDTLQIQLALIASFFANLYSTKADKTQWTIKDFIPDFEKKDEKKEKKQNISEVAVGLALAFGDERTKKWAEKKMGIEEKEYKYPLEALIKDKKKLPARLRMRKK